MRIVRSFFLVAVVFGLFMVPAYKAQAQISVNIGVEPSCPYGYYDYSPYRCAPHGYYGPQWFNGGVFIGAGNWFHGPEHFHGRVNNRYDVQRGYRGYVPQAGERPGQHMNGAFRGNEYRDGHGHASRR